MSSRLSYVAPLDTSILLTRDTTTSATGSATYGRRLFATASATIIAPAPTHKTARAKKETAVTLALSKNSSETLYGIPGTCSSSLMAVTSATAASAQQLTGSR